MTTPPKPRRRRKDARPEEILDAAFLELSEKGIGRSTLASIAARAGISRTTIYLYFQSKQDIHEALFRDKIEYTIDAAASVVGTFDGSFRDVFAKVIETIYVRLVEGDAAILLRALISEGRDQTKLVEFYHREILVKGEATITRMIDEGIRRGDLPASARDLDPRVLVSPAIVAALWRLVFEQVAPLNTEEFRRDHINVVLDGVLKR